MKHEFFCLRRLVPAIFLSFAAFAVPAAQAGMPTVELGAGFYRIEAEVAANEGDRELGLMYRTSMPASHGMLFVFPFSAVHCFWMKNTRLPLSIAFLDENGTILDIAEMAPQTEDNHCPARPARYALEMNQGWFRSKGLKPGAVIHGVDRAPPAR